MLVDLEVEEDENDKYDGATWDSPSQRDYSKEWQQAINKSSVSNGVGLPSVKFQKKLVKASVKLMQRVKIAHFLCVKSVALYHFKIAYVVLHMAVKEFFETHF